MVRTTADLADSPGLRMVAEGVETAQVLDRLLALGCDASRGHLHSRPLPAEEVRARLPGGVQQPVARQGAGAAAVTGL